MKKTKRNNKTDGKISTTFVKACISVQLDDMETISIEVIQIPQISQMWKLLSTDKKKNSKYNIREYFVHG